MNEIDTYDVIVVGGGPGGVSAAVAAGRSGARTLLIEREGCLGGGATTMMVHPFMSNRTPGRPGSVVNAGLFAEINRRLEDRSAGRNSHSFDDEAMKVVLDELVAESGADVLFHAALYDAEADDGRVKAVLLAHNAGPIRVSGKVFIDSTGDALLAERTGCEIEVGDEEGYVMPMTLYFAVAGADPERAPSRGEMRKLCPAGAAADPPLINTHFSTYSWTPGGLCLINAIRIPGDTLDPMSVSRAESEGRRLVENFVAWLRARVPGFENARLVKTGSHIGIRESRRVMGDHLLTLDEFKAAAKFDDAIACCGYPVDKHNQAAGDTFFVHLQPGEYYQVPYRCLTPKGLTNLLIAARSISTDVYVHASVRIMPPVMNIGQAAGYAAAMSLHAGDVRDIDVQALQQKIRDAGGVLEPKPEQA